MTRISNNFQKLSKGHNSPSFGAIKISEGTWRKFAKVVETNFNTPEQHALIGATAMFFQPLIDLNNKKVDDKTRQSAASRSFSRAIIGTISGVAVRAGCIAIGEKLTQEGGFCYIDALKKLEDQQIKNYSKTIGNILALTTLIVTNFVFDVPLINKMSNWINEKVFGHKHEEVKK